MLLFAAISTLIFCVLPSVAHAWGPGTHVEIAMSVVEKLALLAPAVRAVIKGREDWFIYGSVAADIVVGKKIAGELEHCHNFSVANRILKAAKTDSEKAAAYGYLSHLAADIVAHNYYIPSCIIKSYRARLLSHTYWEMRFDMHVRPEVWNVLDRICRSDFSAFDKLLAKNLKRALFSFSTSRQIFAGILTVHRLRQFRRTFGAYAKKSRYVLDSAEVSNYMRLAISTAVDPLARPLDAACFSGDPVGAFKIDYAHMLRWRLRDALKRKTIAKKDVQRLIEMSQEALRKNMLEAKAVLPALGDVLHSGRMI